MNQDNIREAIKTLISTRDMCGNEAQALKEFQADNKVQFTQLELDYIRDQLAYQWRINQEAAGVPQKYWAR